MSFSHLSKKKQKNFLQNELILGDCWISMTQAQRSGLTLATRVGKHTDDYLLAQRLRRRNEYHQINLSEVLMVG